MSGGVGGVVGGGRAGEGGGDPAKAVGLRQGAPAHRGLPRLLRAGRQALRRDGGLHGRRAI